MAQTKLKTYQFDMPNPSCPGRLTLTTGSPVANVTSASVLYFTPYNGDLISLYDGSYWNNYRFAETSLNLVTSASTTGKNYDIFGYISSGSLALSSDIWSSDTARITNISMQNGIYVKSGSSTHRYLGTIRTSASGRCDDSIVNRFVWNNYNQVIKRMYIGEITSHTYVGAIRKWNNSDDGNLVGFVSGMTYPALAVYSYVDMLGTDGNITSTSLYWNGSVQANVALQISAVQQSIMYTNVVVPIAGYNYAQTWENSNFAGNLFNSMTISLFVCC